MCAGVSVISGALSDISAAYTMLMRFAYQAYVGQRCHLG